METRNDNKWLGCSKKRSYPKPPQPPIVKPPNFDAGPLPYDIKVEITGISDEEWKRKQKEG
jgi:hypothetical protein